MVLKPDQQHIKELLTETITLLCCNGLHFKSEFSIDALIGITLDQDDVFLVSIKETFQNDSGSRVSKKQHQPQHEEADNAHSVGVSAVTRTSADVDGGSQVSNRTREVDEDDDGNNEARSMHEKTVQPNFNKTFNCGSSRQPSNKRKHTIPLKFGLAKNDPADLPNRGRSSDGNPTKRLMLDSFLDAGNNLDRRCRSPGGVNSCESKTEISNLPEIQETLGFVGSHLVGDSDVNGRGSEKDEFCNDSDGELLFIKQEPVEKSLLPVSRSSISHLKPSADDEFSRSARRSMGFSYTAHSMSSVFLQLQDSAGCSSWNFPESSNSMQMCFPSRHRWHLEPVESQLSEREVDKPPEMTAFEVSFVRDILSISGSFINIGSAKAFHRNLRQLSREDLSILLAKMNVPMHSCYCVGVLCSDGVSRVFYKCPPELLHAQAIEFYDLNFDVYSAVYGGQVKVSKRVLDPLEWVERLSKRSPYITTNQGVREIT